MCCCHFTVTLHVTFFLLPSVAVAVMVAVPFLIPFTTPLEVTVATALLLVVHFRVLLLALEGDTVTFRAAVFPLVTVSAVLLILSPVTGCFTVILQTAFFPLPSFAVAVIVAVPFLTAFTTPLEVTVATALLLVVHLTALLLALAGPAVAFSVKVFPLFRVREVLFRVILVTGCVTVTLQTAFTPLPSFAVAVIVAVPFATALMLPFESTVAALVLLLFQVTALLLALEGAAVAVRAKDLFLIRVREVLFKVSFVTGCFTVTVQEAESLLPSFVVAVIVVVPFATAFTLPFASTVTIFVLLLFQLTLLSVASPGRTTFFSTVVSPVLSVIEVSERARLSTGFFQTAVKVVSPRLYLPQGQRIQGFPLR